MLFRHKKQFIGLSKPNRLIFEKKAPADNFSEKEQANLKEVSDTVRESYLKRLELMKALDSKLTPIAAEKKQHEAVLAEMQSKLPGAKEPLRREFECLGETIQIVMSPKGEYQEYLNGEPINFLEWAIQKKQMNPPAINE